MSRHSCRPSARSSPRTPSTSAARTRTSRRSSAQDWSRNYIVRESYGSSRQTSGSDHNNIVWEVPETLPRMVCLCHHVHVHSHPIKMTFIKTKTQALCLVLPWDSLRTVKYQVFTPCVIAANESWCRGCGWSSGTRPWWRPCTSPGATPSPPVIIVHEWCYGRRHKVELVKLMGKTAKVWACLLLNCLFKI